MGMLEGLAYTAVIFFIIIFVWAIQEKYKSERSAALASPKIKEILRITNSSYEELEKGYEHRYELPRNAHHIVTGFQLKVYSPPYGANPKLRIRISLNGLHLYESYLHDAPTNGTELWRRKKFVGPRPGQDAKEFSISDFLLSGTHINLRQGDVLHIDIANVGHKVEVELTYNREVFIYEGF